MYFLWFLLCGILILHSVYADNEQPPYSAVDAPTTKGSELNDENDLDSTNLDLSYSHILPPKNEPLVEANSGNPKSLSDKIPTPESLEDLPDSDEGFTFKDVQKAHEPEYGVTQKTPSATQWPNDFLIEGDNQTSAEERKLGADLPGEKLKIPSTFALRATFRQGKNVMNVNYYQDSTSKASRYEVLDSINKPIRAYLTVRGNVLYLTPNKCKILSVDAKRLDHFKYKNFTYHKNKKVRVNGKSFTAKEFKQPRGTNSRETIYILKDKKGNQVPVGGCVGGSVCMTITKFCTKRPGKKFFEINLAKCTKD